MAPPLLRRIACSLVFCATATLASAADPVWPEWRAELMDRFTGEYRDIDGKLAKKPDTVEYLSRRGDLLLFMAAFPEAVADFEKMIEIKPAQDAPHWRLGIAYYFNGQFPKAVRQFDKYYQYDSRDRETGIWKFLAQEKIDGIEKARAEMLPFTEFDREPFPVLYEMYAGKRSPEDVFAYIEGKKLTEDKHVQFFANYYVGLYELIQDHRSRALELLRKAVDNLPDAETVYMWNVARLHWERLLKEELKKK